MTTHAYARWTRSSRSRLCAILLTALAPALVFAQTTFLGSASGTYNWSNASGTTWTGAGTYPNAVGAAVEKTSGTSSNTLAQDVAGGVTVGSILLGGSSGNSWTITATNGITLNYDGAGSGYASLVVNSTNVGARMLLSTGTTITLADDLLIDNRSYSPTTSSTAGSFQIQSVLAGSGNLTLRNIVNTLNYGQIRLEAANTFTGNVLVEKGIVTFNNATSMGNVANVVTLGSSGAGSATLVSNITSAVTLANNIVVANNSGGTLVLGAKSAANNGATATSTYSGGITLNGDLTVDASQVSATSTTGNTVVALTGVISGTGNLTITQAANTGTGTTAVWIRGDNTFTGDTNIASGTLRLGSYTTPTVSTNSLALQNSTVNLATGDTGTLVFGTSSTDGISSATFGGLKGTRNLTLENTKTSPTGVALSVGNNDQSTQYDGVLSGAGSLNKIGTGTLTLTGANSYSGGTTVTSGTLALSGSGALGSGSLALDGGTLDLGGNTHSVGAVTFAGGTLSNGTLSGTSYTANSGTLNGTLTGTAGLTKATAGTLVVSAAQSYTGATAIDEGTLKLSSTGSLASGSAVTIASGASLAGTGSALGSVLVQGSISPGNSPGSMTVGSATFASGGHYVLDLASAGTGTAGTEWDSLVVNGTLDLSALSSSNRFVVDLVSFANPSTTGLISGFDAAATYTWNNVITFSTLNGTFSNDLFTFDTSQFANSYTGNFSFVLDGSSVNLVYATPVPEPSTYAMILGFGALMGAWWHRRQQRA